HRPNLKLVIPQHLGCIQFPVVPRAFYELHHQHAQPLPNRAKRRAQRARRLSLARPGINNQQSFFFRHRHPSTKPRLGTTATAVASPAPPPSPQSAPASTRAARSSPSHADPAKQSTAPASTPLRLPGKSPR